MHSFDSKGRKLAALTREELAELKRAQRAEDEELLRSGGLTPEEWSERNFLGHGLDFKNAKIIGRVKTKEQKT